MKKKREYLDKPIGVSLESLSPTSHLLIVKEGPTGAEHPSVEQMFIRQAVKYLTPKQRAIWEYHNYDRLTQDEIAFKMRMKQQNVSRAIKAIERRIAKYCKDNKGAYLLLKTEYGDK